MLGVLAAVLLAAQWWFLFTLLGQNGRLARRLEAVEERLANGGLGLTSSENGAQQMAGLPVGAPAPAFDLPNLEGERSRSSP